MDTRAILLGMMVVAYMVLYMHLNGIENINTPHYYSLCPYPTSVIKKSEIHVTRTQKRSYKCNTTLTRKSLSTILLKIGLKSLFIR